MNIFNNEDKELNTTILTLELPIKTIDSLYLCKINGFIDKYIEGKVDFNLDYIASLRTNPRLLLSKVKVVILVLSYSPHTNFHYWITS